MAHCGPTIYVSIRSVFNILKLVKEGLQVPPGRNYIRSYHGDDVIALTAYLALINKKTICILPELETLSSYATTVSGRSTPPQEKLTYSGSWEQ